jgi:hypothetical protein
MLSQSTELKLVLTNGCDLHYSALSSSHVVTQRVLVMPRGG